MTLMPTGDKMFTIYDHLLSPVSRQQLYLLVEFENHNFSLFAQ